VRVRIENAIPISDLIASCEASRLPRSRLSSRDSNPGNCGASKIAISLKQQEAFRVRNEYWKILLMKDLIQSN